MRSYPFQVVTHRSTLLIIPSRHEYLADNDSSFVLYVYSALKLACQGLTKSETHTAAQFCSIFTIFTLVSGLDIWFCISIPQLYRNCRTSRWSNVWNMRMNITKWSSRSGNGVVGAVTKLSVGQTRNSSSIPRRDKRFFSSRFWRPSSRLIRGHRRLLPWGSPPPIAKVKSECSHFSTLLFAFMLFRGQV